MGVLHQNNGVVVGLFPGAAGTHAEAGNRRSRCARRWRRRHPGLRRREERLAMRGRGVAFSRWCIVAVGGQAFGFALVRVAVGCVGKRGGWRKGLSALQGHTVGRYDVLAYGIRNEGVETGVDIGRGT